MGNCTSQSKISKTNNRKNQSDTNSTKSEGSAGGSAGSARVEAPERLAARELAKLQQVPVRPREIVLYSSVVEAKEIFTFAEEELMHNAEAMRRETLYMEKALQCMDIVKYPWQAAHFHKWFTEFYQPVMEHVTLVVPIKFCVPLYRDLGLEETYVYDSDFEILMHLQTNVIDKMYSLSRDGAPEEEIKQAFEDVRAVFADFKPRFFSVLEADERFWIPVFDRFGLESCLEMEQRLVEDGRLRTDIRLKAWLLYLGMILDHAMWADVGKEEPDSLPTALKLLPYMSQAGVDIYLSKLYSVPSRKQIMPMCRTEYLTNFKILIEACTGTENVVPSPQVSTAIFKARGF